MAALLTLMVTAFVVVYSQKETIECSGWNECQMHTINTNKVECTSYIGCQGATITSKGESGYVDCLGMKSCHEAKSIKADGNINCAGYKSCHAASPTESAKIMCSGSYSCYCDENVGKGASLLGNEEINCAGYKSCENCKVEAGKKVSCDGAASCRNNEITTGETVECRGRDSCQSTTVETTGEVECTGDSSCEMAKIKSKKATFKGQKAGKDSTVNAEVVEATGYLSIEGAEIDSNDVPGDHIQVQLAGESATADTTVVCVQGTECEVACTDECPKLEVISMSQAFISITITTSVIDPATNISTITTIKCVTTDTDAGCPTIMTSNDDCTDTVLQKYLVEKRKKIKLKRLSEAATGFSKSLEDEYDWQYGSRDEEYDIIPARAELDSILESDINVCTKAQDCQGDELTDGHQQCYGFESCENAYIDQSIRHQEGSSITTVAFIECFGAESCKNAHIFTDRGDIFCDGNEACHTATVLQGKTIRCGGKQSCSYIGSIVKGTSISCEAVSSCVGNVMEFSEQANCIARNACYGSEIYDSLRINCDAISACQETTIITKFLKCTSQESCYKSNIQSTQKLTIDGSEACAYSNISHTSHITAVGYKALGFATIDSEGVPDLLIKFNGDLAGFEATVYCRVGSACLIDCRSDGCRKLTMICEVGSVCEVKPRPCTPRQGEAPASVSGHFCPKVLKRLPSTTTDLFYSEYKSDQSYSKKQNTTPVYYYAVFIIAVVGLLVWYCDIFSYIKDKNNGKYQILHS